jgi:hypothetical protein
MRNFRNACITILFCLLAPFNKLDKIEETNIE